MRDVLQGRHLNANAFNSIAVALSRPVEHYKMSHATQVVLVRRGIETIGQLRRAYFSDEWKRGIDNSVLEQCRTVLAIAGVFLPYDVVASGFRRKH